VKMTTLGLSPKNPVSEEIDDASVRFRNRRLQIERIAVRPLRKTTATRRVAGARAQLEPLDTNSPGSEILPVASRWRRRE